MEGKINNSLVRFVSYLLGTGLTAHAVYIYSLAYYQGYMQELGFPIDLFPADSVLLHVWSNTASRDIASQIISAVASVGASAILIVGVGLALTIPLSKLIEPIWPKKVSKTKLERELEYLQNRRDATNKRGIRKVIAWVDVIVKVFAIDKAYFVFNLVSLSIIPLIFVCIAWIYFPDIAMGNGGALAKKDRSNFEKTLCGSKKSYWSRCYQFDITHIPDVEHTSSIPGLSNEDIPKNTRYVVGNLIVKNNNVLALYTKDGPLVITMPSEVYLRPVKNPCFEKDDCNTEEQLAVFTKRAPRDQ